MIQNYNDCILRSFMRRSPPFNDVPAQCRNPGRISISPFSLPNWKIHLLHWNFPFSKLQAFFNINFLFTKLNIFYIETFSLPNWKFIFDIKTFSFPNRNFIFNINFLFAKLNLYLFNGFPNWTFLFSKYIFYL